MKFFGKRFLLAVSALTIGYSAAFSAMTDKFYAKSSVLAEGNWVRVGVEQTGVYEIPYTTLREMGFSDPSKVSVYGRGGRVLSESFVTNAGVVILSDDLSPVKVLHEDNTLYFYGLGPEEITFETSDDYETGGYFKRKSLNIYSNRGYYFLTDSKPVSPIQSKNYSPSGAIELTKGVSYLYHEKDLKHNSTNSGQLFWGEQIGLPFDPRLRFDVSMPDAIAGPGVMHCEIYLQHNDEIGNNATVSYGFENTGDYFSSSYNPDLALYYSPHQPAVSPIGIPGTKGTAFVEVAGNQQKFDEYSNLDFWVISYERGIPTMKDPDGKSLSQQFIALPAIPKTKTGKMVLPDAASLVVLDVTTPTDPTILKMTMQGPNGTLGIYNNGKTPQLVVFDKDKPQLQISGFDRQYTKIENQNLHAYKDEGADFIIITVPSLREYAEEIAELHRQYDGIKVVVATTEELYNEFSGGTPDPMAYRSFAKMLYFSATPPKNILLLGPLAADFRGIENERNPLENIIAYQSPAISVSRGAHNINDFYGMMNDKFQADFYERNEVQVGVAILPVKFEQEARIVIDKIKRHLERDDHAYYLNLYTGMGGIEDAHTHEIQVRDIYNHIRSLDNTATIFTTIPVDTYGKAESRKKFISKLNEGCSMFSYFGHGAEMFLGKDRHFFSAGDVYTLRNNILPLALFGGCEITNTDRGYRGLGETIVTNTPYGAIGSIVSARETWSAQNYEFFRQFFNCLYTTGAYATSPKRTSPVTIGEVFASLKNYSNYNNELSYQLLCDPALVLPIINRSFTVTAVRPAGQPAQLTPGTVFKMKGAVTMDNKSEDPDKSFNGQVVVRLAEPEKIVPAGKIETGEATDGLEFVYRDQQIGMTVADVENGEFEAEIYVPASVSSFVGKNAYLYFAAYDPSTRIGAGRSLIIPVGQASETPLETSDKTAPRIEAFDFDFDESSINFTVSDNVALNLSTNPLNKGLFLYIDGKERPEAHFAQAILEKDRSAYSKKVTIGGLSYGEHVARLKVKDIAGNITESEIKFNNFPPSTIYVIEKSTESSPEFTEVAIAGRMPAEAYLVVISPEGNEVWRGKFEGGTARWNHDSNGSKVPAGHYKGYLLETGSGTLKGHSEPIDLPII